MLALADDAALARVVGVALATPRTFTAFELSDRAVESMPRPASNGPRTPDILRAPPSRRATTPCPSPPKSPRPPARPPAARSNCPPGSPTGCTKVLLFAYGITVETLQSKTTKN